MKTIHKGPRPKERKGFAWWNTARKLLVPARERKRCLPCVNPAQAHPTQEACQYSGRGQVI